MPKHRKNVLVRTEPRVQPAGKHAAPLPPTGRAVLSIADLMRDVAVGNPYLGRRSL